MTEKPASKKVCEADPLVCPRCGRPLKIISLIDTPSVIETILRPLKLWNRPERPPPTPPPRALHYDADIPASDDPLPRSTGADEAPGACCCGTPHDLAGAAEERCACEGSNG